MADGMRVETIEIRKLEQDLSTVADIVGPYLRSAVEATGHSMKDEVRKAVRSGDRRWRGLAGAVDYEVFAGSAFGATNFELEVGYNKANAAGELGNVREYGTPRVAGHNDLANALRNGEADLDHGIDEALADAQAVLVAGTSVGAAARAVIRGRFR